MKRALRQCGDIGGDIRDIPRGSNIMQTIPQMCGFMEGHVPFLSMKGGQGRTPIWM